MLVGLGELEQCGGCVRPTITPYPLEEAVACTTMAWGLIGTTTYLCTALAEKILIMVYDHSEETFVLKKASSDTFLVLVGLGKCLKKNPCQRRHREFGNFAKHRESGLLKL